MRILSQPCSMLLQSQIWTLLLLLDGLASSHFVVRYMRVKLLRMLIITGLVGIAQAAAYVLLELVSHSYSPVIGKFGIVVQFILLCYGEIHTLVLMLDQWQNPGSKTTVSSNYLSCFSIYVWLPQHSSKPMVFFYSVILW